MRIWESASGHTHIGDQLACTTSHPMLLLSPIAARGNLAQAILQPGAPPPINFVRDTVSLLFAAAYL